MSLPNGAPRNWFPPEAFYAEELCSRCGICCGSSDGHPCEHLRRLEDGSCTCEIYRDRLGKHRTVDGEEFICVPIRFVIEQNGGYADCRYVQEIRRVREQMGQDAFELGRLRRPQG